MSARHPVQDPVAKLQRQARQCFALAREQMRDARRDRARGFLRSMRSSVFCARQNVQLGRRFRRLAAAKCAELRRVVR